MLVDNCSWSRRRCDGTVALNLQAPVYSNACTAEPFEIATCTGSYQMSISLAVALEGEALRAKNPVSKACDSTLIGRANSRLLFQKLPRMSKLLILRVLSHYKTPRCQQTLQLPNGSMYLLHTVPCPTSIDLCPFFSLRQWALHLSSSSTQVFFITCLLLWSFAVHHSPPCSVRFFRCLHQVS